MWRPAVFQAYAPDPSNVRDAHSIYFKVLGEHGWIGLGIFLTLLGLTWLKCSSVIRLAKKQPDLTWARDLAAMVQVSLVGYLSAGTFLGLSYFDYVYHLIAIVVVLYTFVRPAQAPLTAPAHGAAAAPLTLGLALSRLRHG